ncbi:hypothetical protein [Piscinibacter sp. HJYY11]|nr:hypothetical protein [Piscinibacter sp. HJYY11]MBL0727001.1 hypothetical protein [Piscinibacter sp. HJYY11]
MNRPTWWILVAAAAWAVMACDPNKTPKPGEPPKPVALMKTQHLDVLPR